MRQETARTRRRKEKDTANGITVGFWFFAPFLYIFFYLAFYRRSVGIITVESPFFQSVGSSGWVVVMVGW